MLFVISGAVCAGKTTVTTALAKRVADLVRLEEDWGNVAKTGEDRLDNLQRFIERALVLEREGKDAVLGTQAPLGEVLASPRATELEGIAACTLDCHDFVRLERWLARGVHPDWPVHMDHFCWAAYHRLHARDPQFEQRVCTDRDHDASVWSRWTDWTMDDPRWDVLVHDSSHGDLEVTLEELTGWVESVRENGAPLMRDAEWWS